MAGTGRAGSGTRSDLGVHALYDAADRGPAVAARAGRHQQRCRAAGEGGWAPSPGRATDGVRSAVGRTQARPSPARVAGGTPAGSAASPQSIFTAQQNSCGDRY